MTETPPPRNPADEPGAQSWDRQPGSVDWSQWNAPGTEPAPTGPPPPNYSTPQDYSSPPGYPAPAGYQPGYPQAGQPYPPEQGYQPGYPPPAGPGYPPAPGGQYPGGFGDPYAQQAARRFDGISITAFVLGIIAFVPFAIGFGIAGLVRTKGHKRRGRWMAVVGLVLAVAWIGGIVALVAVAGSKDVSRSADGAVTKAGNVSPNNVRVGDCLTLSARVGTVKTLPVVPCDQPHNAQAFANVTVPGSSYPGSDALLQTSLTRCQPLAVSYLGGSGHVALTLAALYPTSSSWALGNRTSHCLLIDPAKNFTGDIRTDK